jgi:hypothetical protein
MQRVAVVILLLGLVCLPASAESTGKPPRCGAGEEPTPIPRWIDTADSVGAATTTDFCADFLEGIPILGRSYQDVLSLAPGVTDVNGDGNPNANGAREGELQILPDGANGTDPVTGGFGQNLNLEAIEGLRTFSTGASAVLGGAQGGFTHVATRSGGNELDGAVKFYYRSDLFDSNGAGNEDARHGEERESTEFQAYTPFFRLGGPLRRDHAWYFVALQYRSDEVEVEAFEDDVTSDGRGWNNFLKFSGVVQDHRLSLSLQQDDLEVDGLGLGHLTDSDSGYEYDQGGMQATLHWSYQASPSFLLELMAAHYDAEIEIRPESDSDCPQAFCSRFEEDVYRISADGFTHGPFFLAVDEDRQRDQLRADVAFQFEGAPSHRFQAGVEWGREELESRTHQDPIRIDSFVGAGTPPFGPFGTISFIESLPGHSTFSTEKDTIGGYLQDVFTLPRLTIQVGVRVDREEIEADGWDFFDPVAEAQEFRQLASIGSGLPPEEVDPLLPRIEFDINGDGRDAGYCGSDFGPVDRYDNDLVTGFVLNENGTYTMVGDDTDNNGNGTPDYLEPDGEIESFFQFVDLGSDVMSCLGGPNAGQSCTGNGDCPFSICVSPRDGIASFDPSLVGQVIRVPGNYGDPAHSDIIQFDPDGNLGGFLGDAGVENPNCDRLNEDTVFLFSVFARHQFDLEEGPIGFPAPIPGYDDNCRDDGGQPDPPLPGTCRSAERFSITNDNIAPRLAVAWDPAGNNKARIFSSWGRYYGTLHLNAVSAEGVADQRTFVYDAADIPEGDDALPFSISRISTHTVSRDLETPFTDELVVGGEYRIADHWTISLRYIHRDAHDQLQDVDRNHFVQDADGDGELDDSFGLLVPGSGDPDGGSGGGGGGGIRREPDGLPDLFVRNPLFNQVLHVDNLNSSEHESYQLVVTRHLSQLWQMNASYTYSEVTGDADAYDSLVGDDPAIPMDEALVLDFDQTHAVKITAMGFLPHGQTFGGSIRWASGTPYSVVERQFSYDDRLNPMLRTSYPEGPRNNVRNEGAWTVDLSYRKEIRFDILQAGFGVEVFNLLDSDDLILTEVDRGTVGADYDRRFGRRWQLGLELHF